MNYTSLDKIYYKDNAAYEGEYKNRKESIFSVSLGIDVKGWEAFFVNIPQFIMQTERIYKKFVCLENLCEALPKVAYNSYEMNCLIDEIMITNEIEGVRSTRKEIKRALDDDIVDSKKKRFEGLVKKYSLLLESPHNEVDISLDNSKDIRSLYDDIVLDEIESVNLPDGELFRKDIAEVISATQQVKHVGVFPESKIIQYVDNTMNILKRDDIPSLFKIALVHYMIGYIHPFYDGNGRLSRFISSWLLKKEFNTLVALRLAYSIKNNKNSYYKAFDICNDEKNRGDLTWFILYFQDVIEKSIDSLIKKLDDGKEILQVYSKALNEKYGSEDRKEFKKTADVLWYLLQNTLFSKEKFGKKELAVLLETNVDTAHRYVESLVADGAPVKIYKEGRKFVYELEETKLMEFLKKQ